MNFSIFKKMFKRLVYTLFEIIKGSPKKSKSTKPTELLHFLRIYRPKHCLLNLRIKQLRIINYIKNDLLFRRFQSNKILQF